MSVYLGMEVLGPGVHVRLALVCINGFLSGCSNMHTCQQCMQVPAASHPPQHLILKVFILSA